jgi:hypothetical protein
MAHKNDDTTPDTVAVPVGAETGRELAFPSVVEIDELAKF